MKVSGMYGTKKQYAERGVPQPDGSLKPVSKAYLSKPSITQMLDQAMEVDPADGVKKLNFEKADELFNLTRDPSKYIGRQQPDGPAAGGGEDSGQKTFTDTKNLREQIKLEHEQINLLDRKGALVERQKVSDACAAAGQKLQEHLKACSRRLSEKFATINDARQIKAMMDEEFRLMLETVSDELGRKLQQPETGAGTNSAN